MTNAITVNTACTTPPTFCNDQCNSDCKTDEVVNQLAECTKTCIADCTESLCDEDGVIAQAREVVSQYSLSAVMDADLSDIEERLRSEGVIPADRIAECLLEYRRFMGLVALGHSGLGMISKWVDEVWHAHILHTKQYAQFCHTAFGRFVHHAPVNSRHPSTPGAGKQFAEIYTKVYGHKLPSVWVGSSEPTGYCVIE